MLEFYADLDAIFELSGTVEGIRDAAEKNDDYLEALLREAHEETAKEFDLAAVASSPVIPHMFEFGTAGITPGPKKFLPTEERARLWEHDYIGHGKNMEASFRFRPAFSANPVPTTASTGVDSKYLKFLSKRKYVFWNKAFVMETGQEVNITAKHGDFLFVPFYGNESYGKYMNNRGYMMWNSSQNGPIQANPGQNVRGHFGALWDGWWKATGAGLLEHRVTENFDDDVRVAFDTAAARSKANSLKPAKAGIGRGKAARAAKSTMSAMLSRAVGRMGVNR
jgi:hypothetical protein